MSELITKTREICRLFEIKPARSKGQNFLINEKIYSDLVKAAELKPTDEVLEVGPGLGFLTARLAGQVKRVVAVELDDKLAAYLQMAIDAQGTGNVEIVNQDILRFNPDQYFDPIRSYKIVANLPYNISSVFLRNFLSLPNKPRSLVLMLQKEVAERIVARPPAMNLLAVSVQYYAQAEIIRVVKAGNFWPEPEVDSAVIRLKLSESQSSEISLVEDKIFFRIVRAGFSAKRKMLKNNLSAGLNIKAEDVLTILSALKLDPKIRAEGLSLENWRNLVAALKGFML